MDIFRQDEDVPAYEHRLIRCHGGHSLCAYTALSLISLQFHAAHTALPLRALRFHSDRAALLRDHTALTVRERRSYHYEVNIIKVMNLRSHRASFVGVLCGPSDTTALRLPRCSEFFLQRLKCPWSENRKFNNLADRGKRKELSVNKTISKI